MRQIEQLRGIQELPIIKFTPQLCKEFRINSIINNMV